MTRGEVRFQDGTTDAQTTRRQLVEDRSMVLTATLTAPEANVLGVRRVFRRQARQP